MRAPTPPSRQAPEHRRGGARGPAKCAGETEETPRFLNGLLKKAFLTLLSYNFFFFLTTVKTRRASLNNLSSSQLRTAIGRSLLADRLTGYPAGPCARIPQASWSTTPAVGGYLIPRESAVPKSG